MVFEITAPSKLAKLPLAFEYDKTLREIKRTVKVRTHSN
jgi:hypothetical protein